MTEDPHRICVYRLSKPLVPHIPLRVRSTGRYDVVRGWSEPPSKKWFVEITWTVSGEGEVLEGEHYTHLRPGMIHVYRPGDVHHLRALSERWRYYWLTLDHPDIERWIEGFDLQSPSTANTLCPESRFMAIADALRSCTAEGERKAAQCAHAILLAASSQTSAPMATESLATKAKLLMDQNFTAPAFDLTELAARLGVHRSTLFRRFMDAYHVKPSGYLLSLRLQFGLTMIQSTAYPIQEIALKSGFTDANYFTRAIRQATGRTPSSFRNH